MVANLLMIVAAYRKATGKSLTTVSKEYYGRGDFFDQLQRGTHSISIDRLSAMLEKFRSDWPVGASWPLTRPIFMSKSPPKG